MANMHGVAGDRSKVQPFLFEAMAATTTRSASGLVAMGWRTSRPCRVETRHTGIECASRRAPGRSESIPTLPDVDGAVQGLREDSYIKGVKQQRPHRAGVVVAGGLG